MKKLEFRRVYKSVLVTKDTIYTIVSLEPTIFEFHNRTYYFGYEVIIMIIVLVITKEKYLGIYFNQKNWMLS